MNWGVYVKATILSRWDLRVLLLLSQRDQFRELAGTHARHLILLVYLLQVRNCAYGHLRFLLFV